MIPKNNIKSTLKKNRIVAGEIVSINLINPNASINEQLEGDGYRDNRTTFTNIETNEITATANFIAWASKGLVFKDLIKQKNYTLSGKVVSNTFNSSPSIIIRGRQGTLNSNIYTQEISLDGNNRFSITFNVEAYEQVFISFNGKDTNSSATGTVIFNEVQLEEGNKASEFLKFLKI